MNATLHAPVMHALLALLALWPVSAAQDTVRAPEAPRGTRSADELIEAVYQRVSFEKGALPDWDAVRELMLPGALIVQPAVKGRGIRTMDVEGFVQLFVDDIERLQMDAVGFAERTLSVDVTQFGDIAHALVVFEARLLEGPGSRPQRGLDSFQLVRKDGRWWIASIATQFELPDDPIPERLLAPDRR